MSALPLPARGRSTHIIPIAAGRLTTRNSVTQPAANAESDTEASAPRRHLGLAFAAGCAVLIVGALGVDLHLQTLAPSPHEAQLASAAVRLPLLLNLLLAGALFGCALWVLARAHARRVLAERGLNCALAESRALTEAQRQLGELGELLQSCRCVAEAMLMLRSAAPALLSEVAGTVFLLNPARQRLERAGSWGLHATASEENFAPDSCWALRRDQAFPCADGRQGPSCPHLHAGEHVHPNYLCVPMSAQGMVLGVLYLDAQRPIDRAQRRLGRAVAEQLALTLCNLGMQESLRMQSLRDALTGLFNRRFLDESLPRELARAQRRRSPLSMIAIDIDHFKRINDTWGHAAGDAVLAQIAALMTRFSREEDIACRHGGEEFVLIMPDAPHDAALRRAEELRAAVAALSLRFQGRALDSVTISVGVATGQANGDSEALQIAADRALYEAKRGGRNRVVAAA